MGASAATNFWSYLNTIIGTYPNTPLGYLYRAAIVLEGGSANLPPTVNDCQGNPRGFWSIHAYQTDATQSAAPFITQASVLNTAYSTANIPVTVVDPSTDTMTVQGSDWGALIASSPILFGSTAAQYGLTPGIPYYVATTPTQQTDPTTNTPTYSFKVSTIWKQQLSAANVPIQGATGTPGPIVQLTNPGGPVSLQWARSSRSHSWDRSS